MVIFKERGWRCERAIPTDFLLSQKQLSGRQEHRHKQATGNRLIEACPDRNFQSDLQICFLHLFVIFGKATLPGLLVQRRQIVPSLFHYSHHLVERYTMIPIGKTRIDISIQSPRRSIGIPFDTRYLHQSAHRIASHPQMMFQPHFGGILDLCGTTSEQLAGCRRSHSTCHSHFALTPHFGS